MRSRWTDAGTTDVAAPVHVVYVFFLSEVMCYGCLWLQLMLSVVM
jgi:hypothetical protein